jgi:hypothetical protein
MSERMMFALREAVRKYPNCLIAACCCNSKGGEWKRPCRCACHFVEMDRLNGHANWTLADFHREADGAKPPAAVNSPNADKPAEVS